jgi:hypothetical protein
MSGIWISYRKSDDPFAAVAIDERLCQSFGPDNVFRDSRSIPAGIDFEPELWGRLARSTVLAAVIGAHWLGNAPDGGRYVDSPDDFVRREIAFAARLGIPIVPILVGLVSLPTRDELPRDIKMLAARQYLRLKVRSFEYDTRRLIDEFAAMLGVQPMQRTERSQGTG